MEQERCVSIRHSISPTFQYSSLSTGVLQWQNRTPIREYR